MCVRTPRLWFSLNGGVSRQWGSKKTTFIYSCAKKAPLYNLDDLAYVVCLERKSLNFLFNGNVVYRYFSTIFHVVLDLVLLRASLRSNEKREKNNACYTCYNVLFSSRVPLRQKKKEKKK